jgi:hypothetical protein
VVRHSVSAVVGIARHRQLEPIAGLTGTASGAEQSKT